MRRKGSIQSLWWVLLAGMASTMGCAGVESRMTTREEVVERAVIDLGVESRLRVQVRLEDQGSVQNSSLMVSARETRYCSQRETQTIAELNVEERSFEDPLLVLAMAGLSGLTVFCGIMHFAQVGCVSSSTDEETGEQIPYSREDHLAAGGLFLSTGMVLGLVVGIDLLRVRNREEVSKTRLQEGPIHRERCGEEASVGVQVVIDPSRGGEGNRLVGTTDHQGIARFRLPEFKEEVFGIEELAGSIRVGREAPIPLPRLSSRLSQERRDRWESELALRQAAEEDRFWERLMEQPSYERMQRYLRAHPEGRYREEAHHWLQGYLLVEGTAEEIEDYLRWYSAELQDREVLSVRRSYLLYLAAEADVARLLSEEEVARAELRMEVGLEEAPGSEEQEALRAVWLDGYLELVERFFAGADDQEVLRFGELWQRAGRFAETEAERRRLEEAERRFQRRLQERIPPHRLRTPREARQVYPVDLDLERGELFEGFFSEPWAFQGRIVELAVEVVEPFDGSYLTRTIGTRKELFLFDVPQRYRGRLSGAGSRRILMRVNGVMPLRRDNARMEIPQMEVIWVD